MAKKDYFLVLDTETTQTNKVADFGAVICDRGGKVYTQCAVLINGIYTDMANHPLFFTSDKEGIWSKSGQDERYQTYQKMIDGGTRMIATVAAVNVWLARAKEKYNPYFTAYNIAFDQNKCANTGIDVTQFVDKSFCLWHASANKWMNTKKFRDFVLKTHAFNPPTKLGNMSYKTNAEVMARFITNNPEMEDEPHTALEDILYYEIPILLALLRNTKKEKWLNPTPFNWRGVQVNQWFVSK